MWTLHAEFLKSHDVVNYEWGLFYPSVWGFSMWHAFNRAKTMNGEWKKAELTGILIGLVAGMNIGLLLHIPAENIPYFTIDIFMSPVISGMVGGLIGALLGYYVEKWYSKGEADYIKGMKALANDHFGIDDIELEKIVVRHVIEEGSGISLEHLRKAIHIAIEENNKAVKESVQKMIDEAIEKKLQEK
jgi:phosphate/sulfate permease